MDNDDELMANLLMEEEADIEVEEEENLAILACLLQAEEAANAAPICDEVVHNQLQHDLAEHWWMLKGLAN